MPLEFWELTELSLAWTLALAFLFVSLCFKKLWLFVDCIFLLLDELIIVLSLPFVVVVPPRDMLELFLWFLKSVAPAPVPVPALKNGTPLFTLSRWYLSFSLVDPPLPLVIIDGFVLPIIFSFLLWFFNATLTRLYFSEFWSTFLLAPAPVLAPPMELVDVTLPALLSILSL